MKTINLSDFKENGFIQLSGFFQGEEVELVRANAKKVFLAQMLRQKIVESEDVTEREFESGMLDYFRLDSQGFINCGKQVQHLISLHRLSLDRRIEEALKQLGLEFPNISTRPVLYFNSRHLAKKEVYWRVFPHQDWRSMQGSLDAIVVWVPLVDVDMSLGALEVVPGSHKLGLLTTEMVESFGKVECFQNQDFIPIETEQGDALFFSAFLVHRSGNNVTDSIRWSCHFRFNNLNEQTFIERDYPHPYIYKPREDLITLDFPSKELLTKLFT